MSWPEGIEARPIDKSDVQAWAALLTAKEKVDREGENFGPEDLTEHLSGPHVDLARDSIGLWVGDRMIGYGQVHVAQSVVDVDRVRVDGTIDPEWRRQGLGTTLMHWLIQRAGELHFEKHPEAPGLVGSGAISTNVGATELQRKLGFQEVRYFFEMRRPLDRPVPEAAPADGMRLALFDPAYAEALWRTHNEVFADHWGFTPRDWETWKSRTIGSRAFRGGQSYLVLDGETIAAYVMGYEWEADTEATGVRELYIGQVGTRRPYRGRGLARAALAKVLTEGAQAGYDRAGLGVDADNPTGALGLYDALGFEVHNKFVNYQLPIPSDV